MSARQPNRSVRSPVSRRAFLRTALASTTAWAMEQLVPAAAAGTPAREAGPGAGAVPRREYKPGSGVHLSVLGFGGILLTNAEPDHARRLVAEAVERGINYFDVAPGYGDAEEKMGPALRPYRQRVFLACKTGQREREGAAVELQRSLERLRTDHFDLYQLHGITDVKSDVDTAFAKGGAMELLVEAKKDGRVRHLGFSAHTIEAAFAAMDRYEFDSVLFPVNFAVWMKGGLGPQIMERARHKGMARLALKALARQKWPEGDPQRTKYSKCWYQPLTDRREAELGLRFTLGQSVTAAIPPGDESLFRLALDLVSRLEPLSAAELEELETLAAGLEPIFRATA